MNIRLGYVALPVTLNITSSSTVTYSHYKKLGVKRGNEKLDKVIMSNFHDLLEILKYNVSNEIDFYRMTSALIPLATHPLVKYEVFKKYKNEFIEIGNYIKEHNLRVDIHPDQFCVLNSINEDVVVSSINILNFYYNMLKVMGLKTHIILHVGGKTLGKKEGIKRFKENFKRLNKNLQKLIVLENDDKVYNIKNVLSICKELNIPMVLDYHHFLCNRTNEKIEDYIKDIFDTWGNEIPKIHFSSPKNKKEKRSHHDYINSDEFIKFIEKIKFIDRDFDVMIEAKKKDEAMFKLLRELKYKTNYIITDTKIYIKK